MATVRALRAGEIITWIGEPFLSEAFELKPPRRFSEEQFSRFCAKNAHLRIEQEPNGKLIIMPPVDFDSGANEGVVTALLSNWWLSYQKGKFFSPSAGFRLPDGSLRSADGCWISDERLKTVPSSERKKFARVVPDFVIEVRSSSDRLSKLKKKMTDAWIKNGVRLAWLIDPIEEKAYIYRQDGTKEEITGFDHVLSGEDVCPELKLDLKKVKN